MIYGTEIKNGKERELQRTQRRHEEKEEEKADMAANAMQDTLADQPPGPPFASTPLQRLQPRDGAGSGWGDARQGGQLLTWNHVGL